MVRPMVKVVQHGDGQFFLRSSGLFFDQLIGGVTPGPILSGRSRFSRRPSKQGEDYSSFSALPASIPAFGSQVISATGRTGRERPEIDPLEVSVEFLVPAIGRFAALISRGDSGHLFVRVATGKLSY